LSARSLERSRASFRAVGAYNRAHEVFGRRPSGAKTHCSLVAHLLHAGVAGPDFGARCLPAHGIGSSPSRPPPHVCNDSRERVGYFRVESVAFRCRIRGLRGAGSSQPPFTAAGHCGRGSPLCRSPFCRYPTRHACPGGSGWSSSAGIAPHGVVEVALWFVVSISAGVCEETVFRGYFQQQISGWTGSQVVGVFGQAAIFGLCHAYQGWKKVALISVWGCVFGAFVWWRKGLRANMIAHAVLDSLAAF
jgi:hypothetical protein